MAGVSFTLSLVDKLSAPAKTASSSLGSLTTSAKGLSTQLGTLESSTANMGTTAGTASLGPAKLTDSMKLADSAAKGFAVGLGAAVVALGAAIVAGTGYAIAMTEAREKTVAMLGALTNGKVSGDAMVSALDGMRAKLGMTTAELAPMAESLLRMGVTTDQLKTQLTAMASVKAIGGDSGVEEYQSILKKLSAQAKISTKDLTNLGATGVSKADIAKDMGMSMKQLQDGLKNGTVSAKAFGTALTAAVTAKGMGPMTQQANSLTSQFAIAKENFSKLFDGINAGPFLTQLKSVFGLLDQSTASGQALKAGITGFFNETLSLASKVLPYVKEGIEKMIIGALQFYIAAKPAVAWLKEMWTQAGGLSTLTTVLKGVGVVLGLVGGLALLLASPFIAGTVAIVALGTGLAWVLGKLYDFAPAAIKAVSGFASAGASMATGFITGLVTGITSGIASAIAAVTNLGSSLLATAKSLIPGFLGGGGAAAPGGAATGGGVAPTAAKPNAVGGLVTTVNGEGLASVAPGEHIVPAGAGLEMPAAGKSASSSASGGAGGGVNVGGIVINVQGGGDAQQTAGAVKTMLAEELATMFEKLGLSQGAALA